MESLVLKQQQKCINGKGLAGGASPARPENLGSASDSRLVFLFFLRSLLLGCHEVFPSVDVLPLQGFECRRALDARMLRYL